MLAALGAAAVRMIDRVHDDAAVVRRCDLTEAALHRAVKPVVPDLNVAAVVKAAMEEPDLKVRTAAAMAMGALNLPSVKIGSVIIKAQ